MSSQQAHAVGTVELHDACCICITAILLGPGQLSAVVLRGCGHLFHTECFNSLVRSGANTNCPLCRVAIAAAPLRINPELVAVSDAVPVTETITARVSRLSRALERFKNHPSRASMAEQQRLLTLEREALQQLLRRMQVLYGVEPDRSLSLSNALLFDCEEEARKMHEGIVQQSRQVQEQLATVRAENELLASELHRVQARMRTGTAAAAAAAGRGPADVRAPRAALPRRESDGDGGAGGRPTAGMRRGRSPARAAGAAGAGAGAGAGAQGGDGDRAVKREVVLQWLGAESTRVGPRSPLPSQPAAREQDT